MPLSDDILKGILIQQSYLSPEDAEAAQVQARERNISFQQALIETELLTEILFENAIAEYYGLPYFDPAKISVSPEMVFSLPEAIARAYSCVIVARPDVSHVTIATSDPGNPTLREAILLNLDQDEAVFPEAADYTPAEEEQKKKKKNEVRVRFGGEINWMYAAKGVIEGLMVYYQKPLQTRFQTIIDRQKKVAPEILQEIFNDAIQLKASDIHFEPQETIVIVRFRVDGVLHEAGRIPKEYYEGVLNRIKIAGNMRIDEHFAAQDGAIRYKAPSGMKVDMRVSVVPLVDGEKAVLRLLSEYVRKLTLANLGFAPKNLQLIEAAAQKPFGMILACGPTGSGKSTTLYALLKLLNRVDVNISTIEDPVEYKIPGINHIQKNDETNLSFANGLRALMRQDPDVLLVGEIRDAETADISVNAALTGHLLFSTIHANTAATAIPRLLEMKVEPFLLASTLEIIIGQRLLRRICNKCRFSYSIPGEEIHRQYPQVARFFDPSAMHRLFRGKGCEACGGTGYAGRMGIHELLVVTSEIEDLIIHRASSTDIEKLARSQGMKLMFEDALEKVQQGFTSLEEMLRVAAPPDDEEKVDNTKSAIVRPSSPKRHES
ncbi:MAG TPA: type II/IV secretion system protein [Candidatus Peribacteraceae bacterium]|nr:type II/IV secretion system protein [Candidatus Peribacteraceae bacterium]